MSAVDNRRDDLEERVRTLEKRIYAAGVVATIFGLSGAGGATALFTAYGKIAALEHRIAAVSQEAPKVEKQYSDARISLNNEMTQDTEKLNSARERMVNQAKTEIDAYLASRSSEISSILERANDPAAWQAAADAAAERLAAKEAAESAAKAAESAAKEAAAKKAQEEVAAKEAAAEKAQEDATWADAIKAGNEWPCPTHVWWPSGRCRD